MPLHLGIKDSLTQTEINAVNSAGSAVPKQWYYNTTTNKFHYGKVGGTLSGAVGDFGDFLASENVDLNNFKIENLSNGVNPQDAVNLSQLEDLEEDYKNYVKSRSENIITNGYGLLDDNSFFTSFEFDKSDKKVGIGSFKKSGAASLFGDEFINIDSNKDYTISAWVKAGDSNGVNFNNANSQFAGFICYDSEYNPISNLNFQRYSGSELTHLTQDLNVGDTVMHVNNASGWSSESLNYTRSCAFYPLQSNGDYGYINSFGFVYEEYGYSRFVSGIDFWGQSGVSGNIITLNFPYSGTPYPAGTKLKNTTSGSAYNFALLIGQTISNEWEYKENVINKGVDFHNLQNNQFRVGTDKIKLFFICNHLSTDPDEVIRYNGVYLTETYSIKDAQEDVSGIINTSDQVLGAGEKTFFNNSGKQIVLSNTIGTIEASFEVDGLGHLEIIASGNIVDFSSNNDIKILESAAAVETGKIAVLDGGLLKYRTTTQIATELGVKTISGTVDRFALFDSNNNLVDSYLKKLSNNVISFEAGDTTEFRIENTAGNRSRRSLTFRGKNFGVYSLRPNLGSISWESNDLDLASPVESAYMSVLSTATHGETQVPSEFQFYTTKENSLTPILTFTINPVESVIENALYVKGGFTGKDNRIVNPGTIKLRSADQVLQLSGGYKRIGGIDFVSLKSSWAGGEVVNATLNAEVTETHNGSTKAGTDFVFYTTPIASGGVTVKTAVLSGEGNFTITGYFSSIETESAAETGKIAVFDNGYIKHRTPSQILDEIGAFSWNYSLNSTSNNVIEISGAISTLSLPNSNTNEVKYFLNNGNFDIVVTSFNADNIDGQSDFTIRKGETVGFLYNGTEWISFSRSFGKNYTIIDGIANTDVAKIGGFFFQQKNVGSGINTDVLGSGAGLKQISGVGGADYIGLVSGGSLMLTITDQGSINFVPQTSTPTSFVVKGTSFVKDSDGKQSHYNGVEFLEVAYEKIKWVIHNSGSEIDATLGTHFKVTNTGNKSISLALDKEIVIMNLTGSTFDLVTSGSTVAGNLNIVDQQAVKLIGDNANNRWWSL